MLEYTTFAEVYDTFMDNVPYDEWASYIIDKLEENNITKGDLVLDLGCGTGRLTRILSEYGYDMIGVDSSLEMLQIARETESEGKILYLNQDMREFELYGTVKAVVSVCDVLNYLSDREDLLKVFKLVNNYLDPKGIFIFDLNTLYKYRELLADNTFAENRDDTSFIWDNYFDDETNVNEYDLTLFIKEGELFRKYNEIHYQRCFYLDEVERLIEESGLEFIGRYDGYTNEESRDDSERVTFICKEITKQEI